MALLVADRAREQPGDIGLRDDRVALTWAELNGLLNRVANGLHRLELGADRRIAVYAENAVETVVAHLGVPCVRNDCGLQFSVSVLPAGPAGIGADQPWRLFHSVLGRCGLPGRDCG